MGPDMPVCLPKEVTDDADYIAFEKAHQDLTNAIARCFLERTIDQLEEPMKLSIYPVGTQVVIGDDIQGIITAAMVRGEVFYEVTWWNGRERMQQLFQECEMKVAEDKKNDWFQASQRVMNMVDKTRLERVVHRAEECQRLMKKLDEAVPGVPRNDPVYTTLAILAADLAYVAKVLQELQK